MKLSQICRHKILQLLFWNSIGFAILRLYRAATRRIDNVLLNRSLHTETNGEIWLLKGLPEQPCIVDVGFHQGGYTANVLRVRPAATIYAFDPATQAFEWYSRVFSDLANVHFLNLALSDRSGAQVFHDYGNACSSLVLRGDAGQLAATYEVAVRTLDEWCTGSGVKEIDLLKVDAEGFDFNVLVGASSLLDRQAIGVVMFEYADGWIANRRYLGDVVAYLADKPYRMFRLFNGFLSPLHYTSREERFDLGFMVVCVAERCVRSFRSCETGL